MGTTFDTPNRNFTRDMFLFSVFTGICYCDMRNLTEKNVVRDHEGNLWIETRRQKTGTPENVRLLDIAIEIMKKYRGVAPDGKLFPMLTKESMNIHLKKMAAQCGIDRNLSFHMARHSFASQICLSQGVPIVTVLEHEITGKYTLSGIDQPPSTILKDMSLREIRRRERKEILNPMEGV